MGYTANDFASRSDVSRETLEGFRRWQSLLEKWNAKINLVSPTTVGDFWERHALDSWQVVERMPESVTNTIDLGSGAGFPGIAIAIALKQRGRGRALMVEAAGKKASFLRTVVRELDLPCDVTSERAERLPAQGFDLVSTRAFAPLPRLLAYAHPFWKSDTVGLFLKGERLNQEIAEASGDWSFESRTYPSQSSATGHILEVRGLCKRSPDTVSPTKLS